MNNYNSIDMFLDTFVSGDFFIVFLAIMVVVLLVLIIALAKSRESYEKLLLESSDPKYDLENIKNSNMVTNNYTLNNIDKRFPSTQNIEDNSSYTKNNYNQNYSNHIENDVLSSTEIRNTIPDTIKSEYIEDYSVEANNINDLLGLKSNNDSLSDLLASKKDDVIDENKPLIKQVDLSKIKTYDEVVSEYEDIDEESAVISADELAIRTKERMETLGTNNNQVMIEKYEEEQETKAIISYEQLLKNASNISLSYKEESRAPGAPKINKIEISEHEVLEADNYIAEEEFLNILKDFRASL